MSLSITTINSILQINPHSWNQICGTHYPFLRHEFLAALERSGCTTARTGWQPQHLCVYQNKQLVAIMPMYQKTNSNGEYVFDWDWANAYARYQLDYYPKLLTAIPFSPCYGPRIACTIALDQVLPEIIQYIKALCDKYGFSSWHGLFATEEQHREIASQGLLNRTGIQYHWQNNNYKNFDEYLDTFTSRKRKSIKRERRTVKEQNVIIECIEGSDINNELLTHFYYCYQLTYLKRGRQGYLNEQFFKQLLNEIPEQIVLFTAKYEDNIVACAWCFKNTNPKESVLYGRYWGCLENFDSLHFETCYYRGLEYCIEHSIDRFDPGAQGEHKIKRGFKPISTYSSHYIADPQFSDAIADFLLREGEAIQEHKTLLTNQLPFKQPSS